MTAPLFRRLSKKEMEALSVTELMEYLKQVIEQLHGQIEDTQQSIAEREKRLNPEPE